jgi:hypothetical protein
VSKGKKIKVAQRPLTFENEGFVRVPDVVKCPWIRTEFEEYPTGGIGEDVDRSGVIGRPIFLGRFGVEFAPIRTRRRREMGVKVRVL